MEVPGTALVAAWLWSFPCIGITVLILAAAFAGRWVIDHFGWFTRTLTSKVHRRDRPI